MRGGVEYVRGALAVLGWLEFRRPTERRFGAQADALWDNFKGALRTRDRIELLIRDADAEYRGIGPRAVFDLEGTPQDEPFGPLWQPPSDDEAETAWRKARSALPKSLDDALRALAGAWEMPLERGSLELSLRE